MTIYQSNGSGGFTYAVRAKTGALPQGIAVADFDHKYGSDLATANQNGASVSVLLKTDTTTIANGVSYTVGTAPQGISAVDLNGDGWSDLVVVNEFDETLTVLMNRGDGTGTFDRLWPDMVLGDSPHWPTVADFDLVNGPDVAVTNPGSFTLTVLRHVTTPSPIGRGEP